MEYRTCSFCMVSWEIRPLLPKSNNGNNIDSVIQNFGQPHYEYMHTWKNKLDLKSLLPAHNSNITYRLGKFSEAFMMTLTFKSKFM